MPPIGGREIPSVLGNTTGLKSSQTARLERLYRRKLPPSALVTPELARALTEISREITRQVGLLIDRGGTVRAVVVGTDREIVIPDLDAFRLGRKKLRGIRCLHTHLKDEALTPDDLTDLALLRLDLMGAIGVLSDGLPGRIFLAHVVPPNPEGRTTEVLPAVPFHALKFEFDSFISALEREIDRQAGGIDLSDRRERAILVSVSSRPRIEQEEAMAELVELARSDDILVLDAVIQRPHEINPRTLLGAGKMKELIVRALQKGATLLVFDQNLTPAQAKAVTDMTEIKVIDRTQLILDIFARRAHTRDGKVQVELAQLRYRLSRLTGKGTAMSRLTGGIGGRGPGEMKLEVDRRRVRDRITRLEKELESLARGRRERRSRRVQAKIPILSLVGYTNAGKSTLLNALTESRVHTEDRLFATLDTSTRRLRFPREREVIVTDTVGFIRDLPPDLTRAFQSTLDELRDASLLLHVVDISNPRFESQIESVDRILEELRLGAIPRLLVLNKVDRAAADVAPFLVRRLGGVAVSALHPETLPPLLEEVERTLWENPPQAADREASLTRKALLIPGNNEL